jgi:hypothetical protein
MTLQEIIDQYQQRQPRRLPTLRTTGLTPLGEASLAAIRLGRLMADLDDPRERLEVMNLAGATAVRLLSGDETAA